ncbi:MAG: methyl-accepting chemotaxis protein [bacterium]
MIQFKFIAYFSAVVIVTVTSLYYVVRRAVIKTLSEIGVPQEDIINSLQHMDNSTVLVIVIIIAALAFLGFIYFHSFTGPLFSLERSLDSLKTGDLTTYVGIRKSDELKDFADKLKIMISSFRDMLSKDREQCRDISTNLESIIAQAKNDKLTQDQIKELENLQHKVSAVTQEFTI